MNSTVPQLSPSEQIIRGVLTFLGFSNGYLMGMFLSFYGYFTVFGISLLDSIITASFLVDDAFILFAIIAFVIGLIAAGMIGTLSYDVCTQALKKWSVRNILILMFVSAILPCFSYLVIITTPYLTRKLRLDFQRQAIYEQIERDDNFLGSIDILQSG